VQLQTPERIREIKEQQAQTGTQKREVATGLLADILVDEDDDEAVVPDLPPLTSTLSEESLCQENASTLHFMRPSR